MSTPADRAHPWGDGRKSTRISVTAAERLTDDLLVEILSRVPARSLCRFKCVSKHWLGLTNDRSYRRKLPRTLTGFYFRGTTKEQLVHSVLPFTNFSGSRSLTSLTFLANGRHVLLLDCCNGLLLCSLLDVSVHRPKRCYIVSNPATEEWTELPHCDHAGLVGIVCLGFDPAVSPHFHVFHVFLLTDELNGFGLPGVDVYSYVYSSETGRWVHKEKKWYWDIDLVRVHSTAYLNGYLHFFADINHSTQCLAADKEAGTMIYSRVPSLNHGFIQQSQGCLYYAGFERDDNNDHVVRLLVYVLEDYNSKEWILKHSIETSHLFGGRHDVDIEEDFCWIAIHPECNLIFFILGWDNTLMCYDMDRRQLKVICNLENGDPPYLPYVPLYEELQSLHK